jgi:hypothetical protein
VLHTWAVSSPYSHHRFRRCHPLSRWLLAPLPNRFLPPRKGSVENLPCQVP